MFFGTSSTASDDENEMSWPPASAPALPHPTSHDMEDEEARVEQSALKKHDFFTSVPPTNIDEMLRPLAPLPHSFHDAEASGSGFVNDDLVVISDDDN